MKYDLFYVGKNQINDNDWKLFKSRFPLSQKLENIDSLDKIKSKSLTKFFWCVWDDVIVAENFSFDFVINKWDSSYIHVFKNGNFFDGICIFSKDHNVSDKEFDYRFFTEKKEIDIIASTHMPYNKFYISNYTEYLSAVEKSSTSMFWAVWNDIEIDKDFNFDYQVPKYNQHITHIFKNKDFFDGVCLMSKDKKVTKKEFDYRFFIEKKEINIVASVPKKFDKFKISTYAEYLNAVEQSTTDMFWVVWPDVEVDLNFKFDYQVPKHNFNIVHVFKNSEYYDGICLFPKNKKISQREFDYRFFIEKKEIDIIASKPKPFEKFVIDTYDDYISACDNSTMGMFWMIPKEIEILNFDFDLYFNHHNSYDRNMNHVFQHKFRNELTYNGISCVSRNKKLSKKEIDFRFPIEKKQYEIVASKLKSYDIVFISYSEPNADENYEKLKSRFPSSKRIHGVKGIHNAHKAAAELVDTNMFYVVDGDAEIVDDFKFDYEVSRYERDIVFIWQSINPINDLIYGYGGVKLLPRDLVISMDTNTVDMTMSISDRLKVIESVSNKTRFDTDEFSVWKSAFRESVKLASRPIDETYDEQTDFRLQAWCSKGIDRKFGKYAIDGARAGREYGYDNIGNDTMLKKINDFSWLKEMYEQRTKNIHT